MGKRKLRLTVPISFVGLIHAAFVVFPLCIGVISQIQPIFWTQAFVTDMGGVCLLYSLLVLTATLLAFCAGGGGKFDLLVSLIGAGLLLRMHGPIAFDLVTVNNDQTKLTGRAVSLLVIPDPRIATKSDRFLALLKMVDVVVTLDSRIKDLEPGLAANVAQTSFEGRSIFLASRFPFAEPPVIDFGEPRGAALIATLAYPDGGTFRIGTVNLDPVTNAESLGIARVTTRRVATHFRHFTDPSIVVGQFHSTAFGAPCRIFSKLRDLKHEVAPGAESIFRMPLRPCVDPMNIIASGWRVVFERTPYPGVTFAKLYRL